MEISSQSFFSPSLNVKDVFLLCYTWYLFRLLVEVNLEAFTDDFLPTVGPTLEARAALNYLCLKNAA